MHPVEPTKPKQKIEPNNRTMNLENLLNDSFAFTSIKDGISFQNSILSNMRSIRDNVSLGFGIEFSEKNTDLYAMRKINQHKTSFDFFNIGGGLVNCGSQTSNKARAKRQSEVIMKKNSSVGNFHKKERPIGFFDHQPKPIPEIQGFEEGFESEEPNFAPDINFDIDLGLKSLRFCKDLDSGKKEDKNRTKKIMGRGSTQIRENPLTKMKSEREKLKEKMKRSINKNSQKVIPQIVGKLSNFKKKSHENSLCSQSVSSKDAKKQKKISGNQILTHKMGQDVNPKEYSKKLEKPNKLGISSKHRGSLKKIIENQPNEKSKSRKIIF